MVEMNLLFYSLSVTYSQRSLSSKGAVFGPVITNTVNGPGRMHATSAGGNLPESFLWWLAIGISGVSTLKAPAVLI